MTTGQAFDFDDVTVVMGSYNEEQAVGAVIDDINDVSDGRASVICVDSSTDRTAERARAKGATVIEQPPRGYGRALLTGLQAAERPVVVTTDCDDTYPMAEVPEFLETINAGYDVVSGNRLATGANAMPRLNRYGNVAFAVIASLLCGRRLRDTTTGMRAYRRSVIEEIDWTENTGLSAELLLRPVLRGYRVIERPIPYRERTGETTLDPFRGGVAIAWSILRVCLEERLTR